MGAESNIYAVFGDHAQDAVGARFALSSVNSASR